MNFNQKNEYCLIKILNRTTLVDSFLYLWYLEKNKGLKISYIIILGIFFLSFCSDPEGAGYIQTEPESKIIQWKEIEEGLYYSEFPAPFTSKVNDSKLSILKINPKFFSFELLSASEHGSLRRTPEHWTNDFDLVAVVNAGMFNLGNKISCMGYLKNYDHINNSKLRESYRAFAMFNPVSDKFPELQIVDMEEDNWEYYQQHYNSMFQCIRMVDCNKEHVVWKPKIPISSSMSVLATDEKGNVLFVFTRSPYTANQMSEMLLGLPLNISSVMYLDGGPEAVLYVSAGDTLIEKVGSWVSRTYANDDNNYMWELPNVIGVKRKVE